MGDVSERSDVGRWARALVGPTGIFAGAPITGLILVLNLVIFLGEAVASKSLTGFVDIPRETLIALGGSYTPTIVHEFHLEALLSSCFLHISVVHLGFNLYALRQVGTFVERTVGSVRFGSLYLATGVLASVASAVVRLYGDYDIPSGEITLSEGWAEHGSALTAL